MVLLPPPGQSGHGGPMDGDSATTIIRALYGETLGRIDEKLKNLDTKLNEVSYNIKDSGAGLKTIIDDHEGRLRGLEKAVGPDNEKRLRDIEARMIALFITAGLIGWILSVVLPRISVSLIH